MTRACATILLVAAIGTSGALAKEPPASEIGDTLRLVFAKTLTGLGETGFDSRPDPRWIDSMWSSLQTGLESRLSTDRVVSSTVVLRSEDDSALPLPREPNKPGQSLILAFSPQDSLRWGVWNPSDSSWSPRGCQWLDPSGRPKVVGDKIAALIVRAIEGRLPDAEPVGSVEPSARTSQDPEPARRPSVWNAPVSPPEMRPVVHEPWFADGVRGLLDFRFDRGWVSGTSSEVAGYSPFSDKSVTSFLLACGIGVESGGAGLTLDGVWGSQGFGYGSESTRKALVVSVFKTVNWDPPVTTVLFDRHRSSSVRSVLDLEIAAGAIWFDEISDWSTDGKFVGEQELSGWFWRPSLGIGLDGPEAFSRLGVGLELSTMSTPDGNRHWKDASFLVWLAFDVKFTRRKRQATIS